MFKTKLEVDKHVDNCLKKINNETERNLKCFPFAKLYFGVGDYEKASQYVSSYLAVKPKSAEGHCLLGRCLEKLGKKEAALEEFRSSLQIDPKQNNLVIKVCELLSSNDVDMDQSGARYFCDLAQSFDPHNPAVYSLRERLITAESEDPIEVSQLLLKELESRPADVNLRVRLLKHFLQHNMIKEAYRHGSAIEEKNLSIFLRNLSWYETFAEVLVRFQRDLSFTSLLTWEFWFLSVSVLDRLVALSLDQHVDNLKNSAVYVDAVFNFDQMLSKASQNINSCPDRQLLSLFLKHYHAQLYFHLATLVFKQAKADLIPFKEAANVTLPVLFAAYHTTPPDLQSMWLVQSSENRRRLVSHWHKEASYRCSQTGHILLASAKHRKSIVIEKATQYSTGMWRDQLFKKVFVKREQQLKMPTSFFVTNEQPLETVIKLPDVSDVKKYDEVAQLVYPDSLHHYIWVSLNNTLSDMDIKSFDGLQYSIKNLSNCAAEALNILDIQAFVYCASLCAKSRLEENKHLLYYNQDKPSVLPASITDNLATLNQSKFLAVAYRMYKNEPGANMSDLRLILIKGIEVVRCIGHHGLDVQVLVSLAKVFEERTKNLTKQSEIEFNNARAELYWKTALPLLEKIKNNQAVIYSSSRLFEYKSKEMTASEAICYIEEGKLFTATHLMKKKEYEKALHIFEQLKDPYASFYQSQIYKHMADQKTNQNKENVTSEMRSQNIILLSRARDCLYLTLDRLRDPSVDRSHPLNAQLGTEIEKMERLLSRIDPDCINRNECDGMSDENASSDNSVGDHYLSTYTNQQSFQNGVPYTPKHEIHNNQSTPLRFSITRQEARPSPERLDAQIRQLAATRDAALGSMVEQNRLMVDSHRSLLDELRSFKDAVNKLNATVERGFDDMKDIKKSVDELKTMKGGFEELKDIQKSVNELKITVDDLQNVVDVVQEMKKEINELKKDQNKSSQINDEDLYVLDPDYGVDYSISSNMGGYGPNMSNVFPNFQAGRMPNPNALAPYGAPGMFPGLYPGLAYAYGGLGLPPTGPLPFVSDQQVPGVVAPVVPGYPHQILGQPVINQSMPGTAGVGISLLAGQALSQGVSQAAQQPKDFLKAATSTSNPVTNTTQISFAPVSSSLAIGDSSKAPPVNVVITTSDPLPSTKTVTSQPVLSVTIPPQHIKGSSMKLQPKFAVTSTSSTSSVLNNSPTVTTQSSIINVTPSLFPSLPQKTASPESITLGIQIDQLLDQTFSSKNNSNVSTDSVEEHDPRPDFKPIIPLPDEVPINTGEELETELFCERAKLFRHVNNNGVKEWKERGVGNLKILHNPESGKVRILMRRDQVHKICANHFITDDMILTPMANNDRAYIWAAHDFAEEAVVLEKFCVRFKMPEDATKFGDAFESAKKLLLKEPRATPSESTKEDPLKSEESKKEGTAKLPVDQTTASMGGFVFTSTPTFKPNTTAPVKVVETRDTPKSSPFSGFSFSTGNSHFNTLFKQVPQATEAPTFSPLVISQEKGKTPQNEDGDGVHPEDFVPTAEFKPVTALPELVEVKTGEENADILFEARTKLFKQDASGETKEWKERGVGVIKVLKDDNIRLVMRRDQVHKVCCNHQLLKNMTFVLNTNNPKAVVWCAEDFSEGVLTSETFAARFKTEEQANQFLQVLQTAQTSLDENNKVSNKHHKPEARPRTTSFGDKFKPAKGSWECKNCYIVNEGKMNQCVACESPKCGTAGKTIEESGPVFSFGIAKTDATKPSGGFLFGQKPVADTWANTFKPAEGSWECSACYIRNTKDVDKCVSCETSKDGKTANSTSSAVKGVNLDTPGLKFSFGMPATKAVETVSATKSEEIKLGTTGFGDAFKPKAGSWECKMCFVRSDSDAMYCVACASPRDDTVPEKSSSKGIDLTTPGQKFVFGISQATATTTSGSSDSKPAELFKVPVSSSLFTFKPTTTESKPPTVQEPAKFQFGSPLKHDFEFKPRSPRRVSAGQGDEESDGGSYAEEEEDNIYFKPVIPMPEKVTVKTGEEDEEVIYCHRAKLFRFVTGEWKERGLGDIKILKQKENGKLRIVMRREQVLKICLNHVLTKATEYLPKDEKSWLFYAADYSEGEIAHEQFCVRFKNADVAQGFKKAVDQAVADEAVDVKGKTVDEKPEDDDDVQIVFETQVTPEEEKEALNLGLPPKFLSYRQLPDCTCDQCKKDDEYLKELFVDAKKQPTNSTTFSGTPTSRGSASVSSNDLTPSSGNSVFGTPKGASFSFTTPNQVKSSDTLRDLLIKPSIIATSVSSSIVKDSKFETPSTGTESVLKNFSFTNAFGQTTPSSVASPINSFQPAVGTVGGSIFNVTTSGTFANSSTSTNLFSSSSSTSTASSTLGAPSTTGSSIFGSTVSSGSIFNTPVFGSATSSNTSLFDKANPANVSNTSIFGNAAPKSTVSFGSTDAGNIFGASPNPAPITKPVVSASVFGQGSTNSGSIFGNNLFSKSPDPRQTVFGTKPDLSGANLTFGSLSQSAGKTTTNLKEDDELVLKCDSDVSFATLAANTSQPAFSKSGDTSFAFLGAGAPVFGSSKDTTLKADKSKNESGDDVGEAQGNEEYDPHYEPIVPLPDAIVVSTGEENETVLFNERARLYRYYADTKEWKERGVGQMKLLFHPENKTYRMLLRREQVHKVVLNQLIVPTLELQQMLTSDKAWMWAGYNYTDDENRLEKLAVRFKSTELALKFRAEVQSAINRTVEIQNSKSLPSMVQNYGLDDVSSDDQNTGDGLNEDYEDEDEDDDDEDEDERSIMFTKRCTLSEQLPNDSWKNVTVGDLQVYYDTDLYAARIAVNDDSGNVLSNTLIGVNTLMDIDKNECTWKAVEWADGEMNWRTLKASFSSEIAAQEFLSNYLEGLNYAQQLGIVDEIPVEHDIETED